MKHSFKTFEEVCIYVKNLPYKRNSDKENIYAVIEENGGTCSTKHAYLKRISDEFSMENVQLMLGIFMMNASNTPKIKFVLEKYNLLEMPEAHNYLRIDGKMIVLKRDFPKKISLILWLKRLK